MTGERFAGFWCKGEEMNGGINGKRYAMKWLWWVTIDTEECGSEGVSFGKGA